jgi:hypothetical protein
MESEFKFADANGHMCSGEHCRVQGENAVSNTVSTRKYDLSLPHILHCLVSVKFLKGNNSKVSFENKK